MRYKGQVKIDVPTMARNKAPNRKGSLVLPPIDPPPSLARPLEQIYLAVVRYWVGAIHRLLLPSYRTELAEDKLLRDAALQDDVGRIRGDLASVAGEVDRLLAALDPKVREWALSTETFHRGKWSRNLLQPTGVDLGTMMGPADVGRTIEAALGANASLIRSVSSELQTKIEGIILRGFTARTPAREIAKELAQASGMSRARSIRIAQDQTLKLSSELDGARMQQAGINDWEWRHSGKLHPRLDHKALNGKRFNFTTNKPKDMPGQLPFCGCKKLAVLEFGEEPVAPPKPKAPPAPEPPVPTTPRPPRPKPQPKGFRSPINPEVRPDTIQVVPKAGAAMALRRTRQAAADDRRYSTSQGDRWGDRSESDHGAVDLGDMTPQGASMIAALIPELDNLADQVGIARIRGIKGVGAANAAGNMGDGTLGLNPKIVDGYADKVGKPREPTVAPEAYEAALAEREQIGQQVSAIQNQLYAFNFQGDKAPLTAKLRELRTRDRELFDLIMLAEQAKRKGNAWKPGDPVYRRPFLAGDYWPEGLDKARQLLFHEFAHHVHQQLNKKGPLRFQGPPPLERELDRLWLLATPEQKDRQLSGYAIHNEKEWFAENFAAFVLGRRDLVDPVLVELIERIFRGEFTAG